MSFDFDLLVLGAGPGGYVAAVRAAKLGLKTAVVEKEHVGGVCLNWGCIPSKSLIHQANSFMEAKNLGYMGITPDLSQLDYGAVQGKSRLAAERLRKGVEALLKKNRVEIIKGEGKFLTSNEINVEGHGIVKAKKIIIATGSRPKKISLFPVDEKNVLSSQGILAMKDLPQSLLIVGAGAIGSEFAHIMSAFGVKVTLVEMLDGLLPLEEKEIGENLLRAFKKRKIKCLLDAKVVKVEKNSSGYKIFIIRKDKEEIIESERILVSIGREPNTDGIGLENTQVKTERGFVKIKDYYQTDDDSIYAIGDILDSPQLAHVASKEGEVAVERIAGYEPVKRIDQGLIPSAVYCEPQAAGFGMKESDAEKEDINYGRALFTYRNVGKPVAIEKMDGLVKVIFNENTREILGAHILGTQATELIHELLLAKQGKIGIDAIGEMVHAHPTISEVIMEAAAMASGKATHA